MKQKQSELERVFSRWLQLLAPDLSVRVEREYQFHASRRWRFDFAFIPERLAVEVDGGVWQVRGGRHNTDGDREKLNTATAAGWRVLRFSGAMLKRDPAGCIETVRAALGAE